MILNFENVLLLFLIVESVQLQCPWTSYEIAGVDNSKKGLVITDAKWHRVNKTTYIVSGTVELTDDFSSDYDFEGRVFYSAKGNNQFVLLPYKVLRTSLCNIVDGVYKNFFLDGFVNSDLPSGKEKNLCPLYKKGKYQIGHYFLSEEVILCVFRCGYYKYELRWFKKNSKDAISTLVGHLKLF